MEQITYTVEILDLPLRYTWALSRNSSVVKQNVIVTLKQGQRVGRGEAAPNVRYGEQPTQVAEELKAVLAGCHSLEQIASSMAGLPLKACSRMALDMAVQNLKHPFLSNKKYPISYTIPVLPAADLVAFYMEEQLARFGSLKLKLATHNWPEAFYALTDVYSGKILLDANEAFTHHTDFTKVLTDTQSNVVLIEQPFSAGNFQQSRLLSRALPGIAVVADEDLVVGADMAQIADAFGGINVKLQKAGSFAKAQSWVVQARSHQLKVMIGCMVETSVGIGAALQLAAEADYLDLDSYLYLKQDPFSLLLEKDGQIFFS